MTIVRRVLFISVLSPFKSSLQIYSKKMRMALTSSGYTFTINLITTVLALVWFNEIQISDAIGPSNSGKSSKFTAVMASDGSSLCAIDVPALVIPARSLIKCSSACLEYIDGCKQFNFKKTSANCELYICPTGGLVVANNYTCRTFRRVSLMPLTVIYKNVIL